MSTAIESTISGDCISLCGCAELYVSFYPHLKSHIVTQQQETSSATVCLKLFVFECWHCLWHKCVWLCLSEKEENAPKHNLCRKHPLIQWSQVNILLSVPHVCVFVSACVDDKCQECDLVGTFGIRDLSSFASVRVHDEARVRCRVFKHLFQLIHVFILKWPSSAQCGDNDLFTTQNVKGRERERGEWWGVRDKDGSDGGVVLSRKEWRMMGRFKQYQGREREKERAMRRMRLEPEVGEYWGMEWHMK